MWIKIIFKFDREMPVYLTVSKDELDEGFIKQKEERRPMPVNGKITLAVFAVISFIAILVNSSANKKELGANLNEAAQKLAWLPMPMEV